MTRKIITGKQSPEREPCLLEGFLYGFAEACRRIFGSKGEAAMYRAVGNYFLQYLEQEMGVSINAPDPWQRYCHLMEVFITHNFYSRVEIEELPGDIYWILEFGQYAGRIWEDLAADRKLPPCPLHSLIMASLAEIGYTIIVDKVDFVEETQGFASIFHFEKTAEKKRDQSGTDLLESTRKTLLQTMLTFCAACKKVRRRDGTWVTADDYLALEHGTDISHGYCPDCLEKEMYRFKNYARGG